MAQIIDLNFQTSDGDKVISLANEQIARTINIGTSWNHVRVGMLMCISASSADISTPKFAIGLTSGTSSLVGFGTTNHFVGLYVNPSTMTFYATPGQLWYAPSQSLITVKAGATTTQYGNSQDFMWFGRDSSGSLAIVRLIYFVDLIKSAADPGTWTTNLYWNYTLTAPPGAIFPTPTTPAQFYQTITEETSSVTSINHYTRSIILVPVSESANGMLDTVNIYWNRTTQYMEVSEVGVYRFS